MATSTYELEMPIAGTYMNSSKAPVNQEDGIFSRLSGVDGRFQGSIRRYPGHSLWGTLTVGGNSFTRVYRAKIITIDEDGTLKYGIALAGYVGGAVDGVWFSGGNPEFVLPHSLADSTYSVTSTGQFLYNFRYGNRPKVTYYSSSWQSEDMGPSEAYEELSAPSVASVADSGGHLNFRGKYLVATRSYHSVRKVHTGLSTTLSLDMADEDSTLTGDDCKANLSSIDLPSDSDYDYLEIFRTLNLQKPLDAYQSGRFFRETYASRSTTGSVGTLTDGALVQQEYYDPFSDEVEEPPYSAQAAYFQGSVFAGRNYTDDGGIGFQWTNPYAQNTEEFSSNCIYYGRAGDGQVKCWVVAGETLLGICDTVIYKVKKSGGTVSVTRLVEGMTCTGVDAACAINRDVAMMTPEGLVLLDVASGSVRRVGALDRILKDEWTGDRSSVSLAYDSEMGCLYCLNPASYDGATIGKMILLWNASQTVTLLDGVPFATCCCGPALINSGDSTSTNRQRAYFVTHDGRVCYPDNTNSSITMAGSLPAAYQSGHGNAVVPSGQSDYRSTVASNCGLNRLVYITSGDNAGEYGLTTSTTVYGVSAMAAGVEYSVDPIIVRLRFWPVRPPGSSSFTRKVIRAIGLHIDYTRGMDSGYSHRFWVGAYRNGSGRDNETPAEIVSVTPSINPSDCYVTLNVDGITVEPCVEIGDTSSDFELTSLLVSGTFTVSKEAEA